MYLLRYVEKVCVNFMCQLFKNAYGTWDHTGSSVQIRSKADQLM